MFSVEYTEMNPNAEADKWCDFHSAVTWHVNEFKPQFHIISAIVTSSVCLFSLDNDTNCTQ